jgi:2-oxoglutarate dehydrogenase E2 component (dihydrolipoamide succinyltransferase)
MADVTLPQLGETVTEGTITQWFKQVGDTVAADEPLFEVSTDKVDTEVPSPVAGVVAEIRVAEGETVEVGTVIAVIGDQAAAPADSAPAAPAAESAPPDDSAPAAPAAESAPPDEAAPAPPEAAPPAPEAAPPAPEAAPPSPATEAEPAPGAEAPTAPPAAPEPQPPPPATEAAAPMTEPEPTSAPDTPTPAAADGRLLSPVVRRLVNEHGIDPGAIPGTGPGGRITREDVLDYIDANGGRAATPAPAPPAPPGEAAPAARAQQAPAPTAPAGPAAATRAPAPQATAGERDTSVKLSKIRRLTGDHMVMSKATSPHAFSVVEVDFAKVDVTRSKLKADWKASEGFSLTYLPFISRAIIDGLAEFPHLNASVADDSLVVHNYIDLGIAVDLEYEGLLAPVIRDAETKRLRALAREIYDLADRARTRKLSPDEIQGGTFTISNNGSAGSVLTMPIINQPQVAIISTDAIVRKPVAVALPDGAEGIVVHPVGNLAMSWDHRAFDGAYAAGFLKRVKELIETRDWDAEV